MARTGIPPELWLPLSYAERERYVEKYNLKAKDPDVPKRLQSLIEELRQRFGATGNATIATYTTEQVNSVPFIIQQPQQNVSNPSPLSVQSQPQPQTPQIISPVVESKPDNITEALRQAVRAILQK